MRPPLPDPLITAILNGTWVIAVCRDAQDLQEVRHAMLQQFPSHVGVDVLRVQPAWSLIRTPVRVWSSTLDTILKELRAHPGVKARVTRSERETQTFGTAPDQLAQLSHLCHGVPDRPVFLLDRYDERFLSRDFQSILRCWQQGVADAPGVRALWLLEKNERLREALRGISGARFHAGEEEIISSSDLNNCWIWWR